MLKRIAAMALALVLFVGLAGVTMASSSYPNTGRQGKYTGQLVLSAAPPAPAQEEKEAAAPTEEPAPTKEPETSNFWINGAPVDGMILRSFDGVIYCPIRTFFEHALSQANVTWENGRAQVKGTTAEGEALTLTARPGDCWLTANDRCLYVEQEVKLVDGATIAPLYVLVSVFQDSGYTYDAMTARADVTLGSRLLTSAASFYNAEDLDLIARVIYQEARNEPILGKIALGNVITNRVALSNFPNTIHDVIYAPNQFTVVKSSRFWNQTPSAECVIAAKLALEGATILPNAVYYNMKGMSSWASRNRPYVDTIGNHAFYSN